MGYELTGNPISSTYTRLVQCVSSNYYDGAGNILDIVSDTSLQNYVAKAGDTMTGDLIVKGKVGIGTITPSQALDIYGNINITSSLNSSTGVILQNGKRFIHTYTHPTVGQPNLFIGENAGNFTQINTSIGGNIGIGYNSLMSVSTGYQNVAIGYIALKSLVHGTDCVALGAYALTGLKYGAGNFALGSLAMQRASNCNGNVAIGSEAMRNLTTGGGNIAIGNGTLSGSSFNGAYNVVIGANSGSGMTSGQRNTFIGYQINPTVKTGGYNTEIGMWAGYNATGSNNVFLGYEAGYWETDSNKLFIDNVRRTDSSVARTSALIYGVFNATPANQILSLGGGGKVGIGTITPTTTLDVSGNFNVNGNIYADGSAGFTGDVTAGQTMRFKNGILIQVL